MADPLKVNIAPERGALLATMDDAHTLGWKVTDEQTGRPVKLTVASTISIRRPGGGGSLPTDVTDEAMTLPFASGKIVRHALTAAQVDAIGRGYRCELKLTNGSANWHHVDFYDVVIFSTNIPVDDEYLYELHAELKEYLDTDRGEKNWQREINGGRDEMFAMIQRLGFYPELEMIASQDLRIALRHAALCVIFGRLRTRAAEDSYLHDEYKDHKAQLKDAISKMDIRVDLNRDGKITGEETRVRFRHATSGRG